MVRGFAPYTTAIQSYSYSQIFLRKWSCCYIQVVLANATFHQYMCLEVGNNDVIYLVVMVTHMRQSKYAAIKSQAAMTTLLPVFFLQYYYLKAW